MLLRSLRFLAVLSFLLPAAARAESAAAPYVTISDLSIKEGDSGTTPFMARVSLFGWYMPIEVDVVARVDSANGDDFSFTTTHLRLEPNGPAQTVSGVIKGDRAPEGDETFQLVAVNSQQPNYYVFSSGGRITIVDDDLDRAPRIHAEGVSVMEGSAGMVTGGQVTVRLDSPSQDQVTVDYFGRDGSAQAGEDYRLTAGTLTFAPGETSKTIPFDIVGDDTWERDETFTIQLTNARRAALADNAATITISNDDAPSVVTLDDQRLPEGNAPRQLLLTIRASHPFPPAAKVWVKVVGGSARLGEDFTAAGGTLYPKAGGESVSFPLTILGDSTPECDEGFTVEYGAYYAGDDTMKTAHFLITDDDGGPPAACSDPYAPSGEPPPDAAPPTAPDFLDAGAPDEGRPADLSRADTASVGYPEPAPDKAAQLASHGGSCNFGAGGGAPTPVLLVLAALVLRARRRRS